MMTRQKSRLVAEEILAITSTEESVNLLSILQFVLSIEEGTLLPTSAKHSLRLTCRETRALIDPFLLRVAINPLIFFTGPNPLKTIRGSSLTLPVKQLSCQKLLYSNDMLGLSRIPFRNAESVELCRVDVEALGLLPRCKWEKLVNLNLTVMWHCYSHSLSDFCQALHRFSTANWPLLESLTLDIKLAKEYVPMLNISDDESKFDSEYETDYDSDDSNYEPEITVPACLLTHFPNLKSLKIKAILCLYQSPRSGAS